MLKRVIQFLVPVVLLTPLVVMPSSFIFPFIVPKIIFFRTVVLLMAGVYVALLLSCRASFVPKKTPVTIAVLLFFFSVVVSTFIGVDWYRSLWDNHERMLGMFTILHYLLLYLVLSSVFQDRSVWRSFLLMFLVSGSIVMLIGVWQRFVNPDLLLNQGVSRVSATLGNPIYFGGYGLFLLCIAGLLYVKERSIWIRTVACLGGLLGFLGIFISGTRGTVVGLFCGIAILLIGYWFGLKGNPAVRRTIGYVLLCSVGVLFLLFAFRQTPLVRQIPTLGNLLNTNLSSGTGSTRMMAWGIAVDSWKERPIFGWGPNNFYYAFNQYYRPAFLTHGWGETWFDNAHNVVMNTLATQGIVGVLAYVGLFGVAIYSLAQAYREQRIDIHLAMISIGFLVAHFFHNVFVFENPTSYLYFFFFLAFVNVVTQKQESVSPSQGTVSMPFLAMVGVTVLLLVYMTNVKVAKANQETLLAMSYLRSDPSTAVKIYNQAVGRGSPHVDDIRNDFARMISDNLPQYMDAGAKDLSQQFFVLAYNELQKNRLLHPLDVRVHIQQAGLGQYWAFTTQNGSLLKEVGNTLRDAVSKSPRRQQIEYMFATVLLAQGSGQEAVAVLKETVANEPQVSESWWRLALIQHEAGATSEALVTIEEAKKAGVVFDDRGKSVITLIVSSTPKDASTKQ